VLHIHKDGGIVQNIPAFAAWQDICARTCPPWQPRMPSVLLSIGTGAVDSNKDGFASPGTSNLLQRMKGKMAILKHMKDSYTKGEREHEAMKAVANAEYTWSKRLNPTGLEGMALDKWKAAELFRAGRQHIESKMLLATT
jgi:hypothetical protein